MNRKLWGGLALLLLFLALWLPRTFGLDGFVTTDERKWLARSANYYYALAHGDWAGTFQREHPGVTVMWAGMAAFLQKFPEYATQAPGQFTWEREAIEEWLAAHSQHTALEMLAAGRAWIVLITALLLLACFFPLRTLLGKWPALLALLFVAWDPFLVALSRQLHPDGFVAALTFLALVCFLAWLYGGRRRAYLVASAVVMGLAWLTKTPAIFLAPAAGLLGLLEWVRLRRLAAQPAQATARPLFVGLLTWGAIAVLTFVVLWPAMWGDPVGVLRRMATEMGDYMDRHTAINYFWGSPTADPGPLFYPLAFLLRTTPATLVGLVLAAIYTVRRQPPFGDAVTRRTVMGLALFALVFVIGMTVGAKKFDRYLLPIFPALDTIAALGWLALGLTVCTWRPALAKAWAPLALVVAAAILPHGALGLIHYPYYLTYYNPLLGGSAIASRALFVGWGEGLDAAAGWLNQQPDADKLRVAAWYADGPFSYFFRGQPVNSGSGSALFWLDLDYLVTYVNQWQRGLPTPELFDYLETRPLVHTVRFRGVDLAHVYDMRGAPVPDFIEVGSESAANFDDKIRLAAYTMDPRAAAPGDPLLITLYLQSLAPMERNYNVLLRLLAPDGREVWRDEGWPWGAPTRDWPVREIRPDGHQLVVPKGMEPGLYKFVLSFYDPATLDPLPLTAVQSNQPVTGSERDVALLRVGAAPMVENALDPPWHFGDSIALAGGSLPAQAARGDTLSLRLQWEALRRSATDYTVFVHVVGPDGQVAVQQDRPPVDGFAPTHLWIKGQRIADDHSLALPADLPAGEYEVRVGLYTQEQGRLPVARDGEVTGDYVSLGTFAVR